MQGAQIHDWLPCPARLACTHAPPTLNIFSLLTKPVPSQLLQPSLVWMDGPAGCTPVPRHVCKQCHGVPQAHEVGGKSGEQEKGRVSPHPGAAALARVAGQVAR